MSKIPRHGAGADDRITCRCLSCRPGCTGDATGCAWEYTLHEDRTAHT